MDISVVLSTYNRCDTLAKALGKLSQQEAPGIQYEIIAVDNNSTDRTPEIVEGFATADARFRYLFEARQGLSYGRNAGIRAARADAIVFTDDDVEVATDWPVEPVARLPSSALAVESPASTWNAESDEANCSCVWPLELVTTAA